MPFLGRVSNRQPENALIWGSDEFSPAESRLSGSHLSASVVSAQRRLCANAECANGWSKPWRNRRRPVFEGQWGCSGRCVLAIVRSILQMQTGDVTPSAPHRHRVPLGLLMLAQGWITHSQLRHALETQRQNGTGRIGEWLVAECGLDVEQIARGLAVQWNCPVLGPEGFSPAAMALVMPSIFVEQFGLLPLRVAGERILYLAFEDHLDATVALAMEQMAGLKIESGILNEIQFRAARTKLLACEGVETKIETASDADTLAGRITAILEQKQPIASRLVRLHQYYWLRLWLERGASGRFGSLPVSGEDMCDYVFSIQA